MTSERVLLLDVSRWQTNMDWRLVAASGVAGVIVKATQGLSWRDAMFETHIAQASAAGLVIGAYHWCDPTLPDESQAEFFLKTIEPHPIQFVAIDIEQYWQYWSEYYRRTIRCVVPSKRISDNGYRISRFLRDHSSLPVVIYTRASFIHDRAPDALSWLPGFPLWLAHYPYARGTVRTTWDELRANHLPKLRGPSLPRTCTTWLLWQFSGDRFILPGTGGGKIDLNYFNGDIQALETFLKSGAVPVTPPPAPPLLPKPVRALANVNLRRQPYYALDNRVGWVARGQIVTAYEISMNGADTWVRIGTDQWMAMIIRGATLAEWV
jgi:lysozyme